MVISNLVRMTKLKGMTFDHDFSYFPPFPFIPKKREKKKRKMNEQKSWSKVMPFCPVGKNLMNRTFSIIILPLLSFSFLTNYYCTLRRLIGLCYIVLTLWEIYVMWRNCHLILLLFHFKCMLITGLGQ